MPWTKPWCYLVTMWFQYGIISIPLCSFPQIWWLYYIVNHITQFRALFIIICRECVCVCGGGGGGERGAPHALCTTHYPPLFCINKLLKALWNSSVDIYLMKHINFKNNYLNLLNNIKEVENALIEGLKVSATRWFPFQYGKGVGFWELIT